jgi:voltage-gated potassium channel
MSRGLFVLDAVNRLTGRGSHIPVPTNGSLRERVVYEIRKFAARGRNVFLLMVSDVFLSGMVYWALEGKGPVRSLWWSIVTASTVGYGDIYPTTTAGRAVAAFLIVSMVMLLLLAGAHLTAWLIPDVNEWTNAEQEEIKVQLRALEAKMKAIMDHFNISVPEDVPAETHLTTPPL